MLLQSILVYAFCLLVGLVAAGVCGWVVATGQLFTIDGLTTIAVSLAIAAFFVGDLAWAVYTGEVGDLLRKLRDRSRKTDTPVDSAH